MTFALFTRITPEGHVLLTQSDLGLFRRVGGGNKDLATTKETRIDREGAGSKKTEAGRRRETEHRRGAIETRQHGFGEWREQHEGIGQADERAAHGREDADRQP